MSVGGVVDESDSVLHRQKLFFDGDEVTLRLEPRADGRFVSYVGVVTGLHLGQVRVGVTTEYIRVIL